MNFFAYGLYSKAEKQEFLDTRKIWKTPGREDTNVALRQQEEALDFQRWMNKVLPRPDYKSVDRLKDNVRFLNHRMECII